jgi:hypothetical protein
MSDLFNNVKPGDMVHYKTPQGQHGKGKVVLRYDTHVVVNRGKGQPQVVNDKNYVKHERGGKVIGALLSRLKEEEGIVEMRNPSGPYGGDPYDWDPTLRKAIFAAAAKKVKKLPGSPQPSKFDTGRPLKSAPAPFRRGVKEDSHDLEGKSSRVAKTKKHKRKLVAELDNSTLASYVSKSIADRKIAQLGYDMAGRIHTGERLKYFQNKAIAKIEKRGKGIKTAVGKIASNLPGVKEARENEWSANVHMAAGAGKASKPAKGHYLMRDGRRLSGPHTPEAAVGEYRKMSDSKGVKIVHVKEGVEYDVTLTIMEESKVKKAAQRAIKLAKDAKKGKVDTKPTLDVADKGSGGPINGSLETPEGS